tara:strand:- start:161 stop:682 length:522 start_codon:yes stop_codon:yes gene_type:complete
MAKSDQSKSRQAIMGRIKSIKGRGKTLDTDTQTAIKLCAVHSKKYGDFTCFNRLIEALPKSSKTSAITSYISDVTPLNFSSSKNVFSLPKNKEKRRPYDFETIDAVPFWEYETTKIKKVNVNNLLILSDIIEKALKSVADADEITGDFAQFQSRVAEYKKILKPVVVETKKAA